MKKFVLILFALLLSVNMIAQSNYEKYINAANEGNPEAQLEIG